jgi:hypothetical protein
MITSTSKSLVDGVETILREKFKTVTVKGGSTQDYLGMQWDFSSPGEVKVTMEGYIAELIKSSGTTSSVLTPATDQLFNLRDSPILNRLDHDEFHSMVARLLYLAKRVRPDILLPVSFLATRVQNSTEDDQAKLKRVLMYLNGSSSLGIILRPDKAGTLNVSIDSSYGVHADGKSHSAMSIAFGAGSILAQSTKQKLVSKSSTESELIALSDKCSLAIWSRDFLLSQGQEIGPAQVWQDNMSTIALTQKGGSTSERTRHINIRYYWVKDRIGSGELKVEYQPTEEMIADILTKPLQGAKFLELRSKLLNWEC